MACLGTAAEREHAIAAAAQALLGVNGGHGEREAGSEMAMGGRANECWAARVLSLEEQGVRQRMARRLDARQPWRERSMHGGHALDTRRP